MNVSFIWHALGSRQMLSFFTGRFLKIQVDIPSYLSINLSLFYIFRVLASCLPYGRYPLLNVEAVTGMIISIWIFSFFMGSLVTLLFDSNYEPAVVLCIPDLPIGFFITIFSIYCLALFGMVGGYIVVLICLKKRQAQIQNTNTIQATDYKGLERAALTR